jgi:tetratricopeptide (TPR) repeat protein
MGGKIEEIRKAKEKAEPAGFKKDRTNKLKGIIAGAALMALGWFVLYYFQGSGHPVLTVLGSLVLGFFGVCSCIGVGGEISVIAGLVAGIIGGIVFVNLDLGMGGFIRFLLGFFFGVNTGAFIGGIIGMVGKLKEGRMSVDELLTRGETFYGKHENDRAIKDFTRVIELDPNNTRAYKGRGAAYLNTGQPDSAIADYSRAIELDPDNGENYYRRGLAYNNKSDLARAIENYEQAFKLAPDNKLIKDDLKNAREEGVRKSMTYGIEAMMASHQGEYDVAIAAYTKVIELKSEGYGAGAGGANYYVNRGDAFYGKGDRDSAIADYTRAIDIDPGNTRAYYSRGSAFLGKGEHALAIADGTQAIGLKADYAEAYALRGTAYTSKGDDDLAIADLTKAVDIKTDYAQAYSWRALAYFKKDDLDHASADCERALQIDPNLKEANMVFDAIKQKRGY